MFNNGLILQFGKSAKISGADTTITQTLPLSFKTSISMVLLTNSDSGYRATIYVVGAELTNIKIRREANSGVLTSPVYWCIIGY